MKINNDFSIGWNFYEIKGNTVTFWGINIEPFSIELNSLLMQLIVVNELPYNEVVEITENEDFDLLNLSLKLINKLNINFEHGNAEKIFF